jgi:8-oxo-dGTP diphosphatase
VSATVSVGVGALVVSPDGTLFLARRGGGARNEVGTWEFPGGGVEFGERMEDAVRREFAEEYGMEIAVTGLLGVFDHILTEENQHWICVTYLARHVSGTPTIREPGKCEGIGWFPVDSLPSPLSKITQQNLAAYPDAGG